MEIDYEFLMEKRKMNMNKTILVIHTGGTISMVEDAETGAVKPVEKKLVEKGTRQFDQHTVLIIEEPFHLPSPHITPKEMLVLKNIIEKKIDETTIDGVVITHGTDTLEETAYFLDLTLSLDIPVVVTGAMRSSNELGSDGPPNFISSVRVAKHDDARNKGVMVVLNEEIHSAKNVTKTHASNLSTFQSPQYGPIGIVTKRDVVFHHQPLRREYYDIKHITKKVALIKAYAGFDSSLLYALCDMKIDGVIIEALGQGNLPPQSIDGIKRIISKNIPIVLVSRCFNGITQDVYGYEGGGIQLKELGVVFSNGLNGQKAQIKLLIALCNEVRFDDLPTVFSV